MFTVTACGSPSPFLVENSNATLYSSFFTDPIPLTEGQIVDLTSQVYRPKRTLTLRAINAPQPELSYGSSGQFTITDHNLALSGSQDLPVPVVDGVGEHTASIADLPNATVNSIFTVRTAAGTITKRHRGPAAPLTVLDFAQGSVAFPRQPTYANNMLSWTEQGAGGDS
jgi:hypothetical protein